MSNLHPFQNTPRLRLTATCMVPPSDPLLQRPLDGHGQAQRLQNRQDLAKLASLFSRLEIDDETDARSTGHRQLSLGQLL